MQCYRNSFQVESERQQGNDEGWKMTEHKRTYNNHCKDKKRNRFQTDFVLSGVLTLFVVVVLTKSILEILLAHVGSHVSLIWKLGGV